MTASGGGGCLRGNVIKVMHQCENGHDTMIASSGVLTPLSGGYSMPLLNGGGGIMSEVKYVCSECGREDAEPGMCAVCRKALVATCVACGNPVVGEHVHQE